jgi:ribosomal protein S18 acetylase RimI-like enzyme
MNLLFKKALKEDAPLINALAVRIWNQHYITIISQEQIDYMLEEMYSVKHLLEQMDSGHQFTIVYNNGVAVGYLSIEEKADKNYFLHKFYIEVNDHGKGIGSELFVHVLDQLKGAKSIELFVNRVNYKSINFYFKHGFVIKKVIDQDIGEGFYMNDYVMIRETK